MQKLKFLKPAIPLTVISVVIALMLSLVNGVTADRIKENAAATKEAAIKGIFEGSAYFSVYDESASEFFEDKVTEAGKVLNSKMEVIGYYAEVSPPGFKGEINLIVGVDTEGKIAKISVLSASETPGLGTKATESSKLAEYVGNDSKGVNDVTTITGATISSSAVKEGVKNATQTIENLIKEGK